MSTVRTMLTTEPNCVSRFWAGGVAAWLLAALTVIEVVVFSLYPLPGTISGWFELFHMLACHHRK